MFHIQAFGAEGEQQNCSSSMQKLARDLTVGPLNCNSLSLQHEPNFILGQTQNTQQHFVVQGNARSSAQWNFSRISAQICWKRGCKTRPCSVKTTTLWNWFAIGRHGALCLYSNTSCQFRHGTKKTADKARPRHIFQVPPQDANHLHASKTCVWWVSSRTLWRLMYRYLGPRAVRVACIRIQRPTASPSDTSFHLWGRVRNDWRVGPTARTRRREQCVPGRVLRPVFFVPWRNWQLVFEFKWKVQWRRTANQSDTSFGWRLEVVSCLAAALAKMWSEKREQFYCMLAWV